MENILMPIAVGDIIKHKEGKPEYHFYIPSYQRGYRWDDDEVTDLLEDLYEFVYQVTSNKYCLQPIVVKRMNDNSFEVLDGQQRLTTVFILLKCLKTYLPKITSFAISYQTRPNSADFLEELTKLDYTQNIINDENPDYYYISKAYSKIGFWLDQQSIIDPDITSTFFAALVKKVEFIWYEITEKTDAIEVFTRINIGKILLTNAELVKAVFLSKNNLVIGIESYDEKWLNTIQNKIATDWDTIQSKLLNEKFWGFIFSGSKDYETRVDYILELKYDIREEKNKYASFRCFYNEIKQLKKNEVYIAELSRRNITIIEEEWAKLKFIVDILEDWYEDHFYFHHIGFLISQGFPILDLIKKYIELDKHEFKELLSQKIRDNFRNTSLSVLRYGPESKLIERVLLLYNILSTYKIQDDNHRFPFELYKNNNWSLEHIYAQNSEELRIDQYETWLKENLKSLKNIDGNDEVKSIINEIEGAILEIEKLKKDTNEFTNIFNKVSNYYQKKVEEIDALESIDNDENTETESDTDYLSEVHSIVNLALLDSSSNSCLNNSLFDVKRMLIIDKDKNGTYVPIETKRVFLKYHTTLPKHLFYWTIEDKKAYMQNIAKIVSDYIVLN